MTARILLVFGTRPEAIKMAPLVLALKDDPRFETRVCVTAQHREMLDSVLRTFEITPDHDLSVMTAGQDLFDVSARVLLGMRGVLREEAPDLVLVHGDTTTCFAASLAAFYARVPVGHVEAGLRSFDLDLPFPEEMNRRFTDLVAAIAFAPTASARENLLAEGVEPSRIHVTGNTGIDALRIVEQRTSERSAWHYATDFGPLLTPLLHEWPGHVVLVTGHRRESFGRGIDELCAGLRASALAHPDWLFVYPMHPNPNVTAPVRERLGDVANVFLCEPLEYEPFTWLMKRSSVIVTDSGGIQEEAPSLGKPVLVTRDVTERPEALESGTVRLVGCDAGRIAAGLAEILGDEAELERVSRAHDPYGDGHACERIVEACARTLGVDVVARAA